MMIVIVMMMMMFQYMNTVPTVGFNCERVKGTVGKSR